MRMPIYSTTKDFDDAFESIFGTRPKCVTPAELPELTPEQLAEGDLTEELR